LGATKGSAALSEAKTNTKTRKRSTDNEDLRFIIEVDGHCPLCGKSLVAEKNGRSLKRFEIAHIYPHSPTKEQIKTLQGLRRLADSESFENRIALCLDCHDRQDFHTTVKDYNRLVKIKEQLLLHTKAMDQLSPECIGEQIEEVLRMLTKSSIEKLEPLKLEAVCVDEKIENNFLLLYKIREYVLGYFRYVQECFKQLESEGKLRQKVIASKMKTSFLMLNSAGRSQEEIFTALAEWLYNQSQKKHKIACEIIIAYFVQDCEVFDVIAK
jgi:cytochrome c553